eukprot:GHVT01013776.1.p1 GENE.GHVT01013776.1~~GHVT01013776.1.p1  ORF type:complete len:195 (+),score=39.02 GHVT01013776.1:392-976(+)
MSNLSGSMASALCRNAQPLLRRIQTGAKTSVGLLASTLAHDLPCAEGGGRREAARGRAREGAGPAELATVATVSWHTRGTLLHKQLLRRTLSTAATEGKPTEPAHHLPQGTTPTSATTTSDIGSTATSSSGSSSRVSAVHLDKQAVEERVVEMARGYCAAGTSLELSGALDVLQHLENRPWDCLDTVEFVLDVR